MKLTKTTPDMNLESFEKSQSLEELLSNYSLQQHGSSVFIYSIQNRSIVAHFNSFDNTLLILQPEGFPIANALGSKRFPIGAGRQDLSKTTAATVNAIEFKRDLQFPLLPSKQEPQIAYKIVDLPQLLQTRTDTSKVYSELVDLFNRCSDYAPSKKEEFVAGGAASDKFCRFNRENLKTLNGICTINTFLLDESKDNKIIGTQSATIVLHPSEEVDIYLYDEVVDYSILLSPDEILKYQQLCDNKPELSEEDKRTPIALLVESKRGELFAQLFSATREKIFQKLQELLPKLNHNQIEQLIISNKVRAIIRAAAVWYPYSATLNCVPADNGIFVIHGPRTDLGNYIDKQIKDWAATNIKAILESNSYPSSPGQKKQWPKSVFEEIAHTRVQDESGSISNETTLPSPNK